MHTARGNSRGQGELAIEAHGLTKRFGTTLALRGIDLRVERGGVCGLLGPNGAGKTTAVRILTTLLRPDGGSARVDGYDVVSDAEQVRFHIGLAGQYAAVDELLPGRANLEMVGRLYHLGAGTARARAETLLEQFSLTDAADRLARTYSGGMRRRLDLACSLVASPSVLFLDEPTTGLDPNSRLEMWASIQRLVAGGTTVLLTTQNLEEADRLASSIVVIDKGEVIASGTPDQLKTAAGSAHIDMALQDPGRMDDAAAILERVTGAKAHKEPEARRITAPIGSGTAALGDTIRALDAAGIGVDDIALRRPTLDEVFMQLTGSSASAADARATGTQHAVPGRGVA